MRWLACWLLLAVWLVGLLAFLRVLCVVFAFVLICACAGVCVCVYVCSRDAFHFCDKGNERDDHNHLWGPSYYSQAVHHSQHDLLALTNMFSV